MQQIMFYRELGVSLDQIRKIITSPTFNKVAALQEHHAKRLEKRKQLELLIANVDKTLAMTERRVTMSDKEKFEGFKEKLIEENELKYGKEIREKYGEETMNRSNEKLRKMTEVQYDAVAKLSDELNEMLKEAFAVGDPASDLAQKACEMHKQWLLHYWDHYSKEAHMALVQGYLEDERFKAYYDNIANGCAVFLRDAMCIYTGIEE